VGCQACVVACSVENEILPPQNWRKVLTYNKSNYPDLPVINLSLACNHCEQASCLDACPAKAYSIDEQTGSVLLNAEVCMGCKYCTWACPFDAPRYDKRNGVVSKCTFCNSRLNDGGIPACSKNCPTGALSFDCINDDGLVKSERGFPESSINPRIRFIPERKRKKPKIIPSPSYSQVSKYVAERLKPPDSKISIKKDWTLLVFTLLVPLLVATIVGVLSGYVFVNAWVFSSAGVLGLLLSTLHLGKKLRAIYALRNLKSSWLSREIFFYGLFLVSSIVYLSLDSVMLWLGIVSIAFGVFCLFSMDRVYKYFRKFPGLWMDSSSVFLSGLMWISLILQEPIPLFFIIGIKTFLVIFELIEVWNSISIVKKYFYSLRVFLLLVLPVFLFFGLHLGILYLFIPLFLGEIIDRFDFYSSSYIDSPENEYFSLLKKDIKKGNLNSIHIN